MTKEFLSITEILNLAHELKSIRELKSNLSKRELRLLSSIFNDFALIPRIYELFKEIISESRCQSYSNKVSQRKMFVFIIVLLFAPNVITGGRMPSKLRAKIAGLFPDISPCVISNNIADVSFIYRQYKDFQTSIEYFYGQIVERLKEEPIK